MVYNRRTCGVTAKIPMAFVTEEHLIKFLKLAVAQISQKIGLQLIELPDAENVIKKGALLKLQDLPAELPYQVVEAFHKTESVLSEYWLDKSDAIREGQASDTFQFVLQQTLAERPAALRRESAATAPLFAEVKERLKQHRQSIEEMEKAGAAAQDMLDTNSHGAGPAVVVQSASRLCRPAPAPIQAQATGIAIPTHKKKQRQASRLMPAQPAARVTSTGSRCSASNAGDRQPPAGGKRGVVLAWGRGCATSSVCGGLEASPVVVVKSRRGKEFPTVMEILHGYSPGRELGGVFYWGWYFLTGPNLSGTDPSAHMALATTLIHATRLVAT